MASSARARSRRAGVVGADAVDRHRLDQRLADREARVERRVRVLEHDLDALSHRQQLGAREREQVAAVEDRLAAGRAAARLVQAQQRQAERRLARARLADDAERVAGAQLESRAPARPELLAAEHAAADPEALGEPVASMTTRRAGSLAGAARRRRAAGDVVVDDAQARRALRRASAGRPAAPACRRPAARRRCAPTGALLAHDAVAHDDDVVGDLADDAEVVADEQHAHPVPLLQPASSSRIWRWIVTSSAVVGSSAISSFGSQASAIAIITRCCWPPESSCG